MSVFFSLPRTDTFHRNAKFVGHLKAIKVYRDGWGIFPHWHLARVSLHMVQLNSFFARKYYRNQDIITYDWILIY